MFTIPLYSLSGEIANGDGVMRCRIGNYQKQVPDLAVRQWLTYQRDLLRRHRYKLVILALGIPAAGADEAAFLIDEQVATFRTLAG